MRRKRGEEEGGGKREGGRKTTINDKCWHTVAKSELLVEVKTGITAMKINLEVLLRDRVLN